MSSNQKIVIDNHDATLSAHAPLPASAANENAAARPGNDNAARGAAHDTTSLVAAPEVVQTIRAALRRRGVRASDMADLVADVQAHAIAVARTKRMPANLTQWRAFTATIAARRGLNHLRRTILHAKVDLGPVDDADAYVCTEPGGEPRDPVDGARHLALLKDLFDSGAMPEAGREILQGVAEGASRKEIAAELGVTEAVVKERLARMRATFRARLALLGLLAVPFFLVLLALFYRPHPESAAPNVAHPRPAESAPDEPCPPAGDAGVPAPEKSSRPARRNCGSRD